jgi:hypothetical protein
MYYGRVKSLTDLAFIASYKEVESNLLLTRSCPSLLSSTLISLQPSFRNYLASLTNENILKFIKERLDAHLIGHIGFRIRKEMVEKFFTSVSPIFPLAGNVKPDAADFLDCVLNDKFTEICIQNPAIEKIDAILAVVYNKSPNISSLNVNYCRQNLLLSNRLNEQGILLVLQKFTHLTSLQLDFLPENCSTLLCKLGVNCPQLIHLSLGSFFFGNEHGFALILGEGARLFPVYEQLDWYSERNSTHELEFDPSCLTPLCKTLKSLEITRYDYPDHKFVTYFLSAFNNPHSTLGFALRHLTNLEEIKLDLPYLLLPAYAVQALHRQSLIQADPVVREIRTIVDRRALDAETRLFLKWTCEAPFSRELFSHH